MVTLKRVRFKIHFTSRFSDEIEIIKDSLTFEHPEFYNIPSYHERDAKGKRKWDGNIRMYTIENTFNIGLLKYVEAAIKEHKIDVEYKGFELPDLSHVKFSPTLDAENRDYQRNAIIKQLQEQIGCVQIPTRGGKTYVAGEEMRILLELNPEHKFLFVTDSSDALVQLPADLAPFLGENGKKIGIIEGDRRDFQKVTIGMIQTIQTYLRRKEKDRTAKDKEMIKYLESITVLMVDEIHEHMSDDRLAVIKKIVWRKHSVTQYFFQYTATFTKTSNIVGTLNLEKYTGGIIYDITQRALEERGVLAKSKILLLINEIHPNEADEETYAKLKENVIFNSVKRNMLLCNVIQICNYLQLKTLVMFSSKTHGNLISEVTGFQFLSGDDSISTRKLTKEKWLADKGGVLLVSEIWKKAITLPDVEVFVNADGGKEDTLIKQKKGRVLGVTDTKKKAVIIDIIDILSEYFSDHSMSRISAYESTNSQDDIDTMENDDMLQENLMRYLYEWFECE